MAYTTGNIFWKPAYGTSGTGELNSYNSAMDTAAVLILAASSTASSALNTGGLALTTATNGLSIAQTASTQAGLALTTATSAYATGTNALSIAVTASTQAGLALTTATSAYNLGTGLQTGAINFIIDGGGAVIATGVKGDIFIPFTCTFNSANILADTVGTMGVDLWVDTYGNFPPTNTDSITGTTAANAFILTTASAHQNNTLGGWVTTVSAGSILRINISTAAVVTRATIAVKFTR